MYIRPAAAADAEALTELHLDVWEEAYGGLIPAKILDARRAYSSDRIERWREIITHGTSSSLLAWPDGGARLIGFVSTGPGRDQPRADLPEVELSALYVRAEVYGRGVGYALLHEAIGSVAAYLWVLEGNQRAIDFYRRQGFRFDGCSKIEPVGIEHRMVRPGMN